MAAPTAQSDPCISLQKGTLVLPVPRYPSSVVTDASLKIAANQVTTTLVGHAGAGDTILRVSDTSRLVVDMLLTIDNEIVSVSAIDTAGNTIIVVRGFDGTVPSSHNAGRTLAAYIDAWHHNALAAEVKAIETALGPNLSNISGAGAGAGAINAATYNFAAQAPGGNLVVGNNVITLSPVPRGVNGSNTFHYLYVSGGTGAAEAVLITGGTAVSGAPSGTLFINCANAHSGAWTIRSATAGIQEALWEVVPTNGNEIRIPPGPLTVYAPTRVAVEGVRITGSTRNNNAGYLYRATGLIFDVEVDQVEIAYLALRGGAVGGVAAPAGNCGIMSVGACCHFHDLTIDQIYGGIELVYGHHTKVTNIFGRNCSGYLIKHTGGVSPFLDTISYAGDLPYEVASEAAIVLNASGAYVYNTDILLAKNGILIEPTSASVEWVFIYDARFDQNFHAGVSIRNASSTLKVHGVFIHDLWAASTGTGLAETFTSGGLPPGSEDGVGLLIGEGGGPIDGITVDGGEIHNNREQNVKIQGGTGIKLFNLLLLESNLGHAPAGTIDNVYVQATDLVEITDCVLRGAASGEPALRSAICAAAGNVLVRNCRFNGTFQSFPVLAVPGVTARIDGFNPGMDDNPQVLASAATVTLPSRQYFHITGTTGIDTITPTWQGRMIFLFKPDAGAWTMTTAGNIAKTLTVNANESAICIFTGGKWVCWK